MGGLCVALTAGALAAEDNGIDPELRADIKRLIEVTKATEMGRRMGDMMARRIVQMTGVYRPEAIARCRVLAAEMVKELLDDDKLMDEVIPIYARHFTHADVRGTIDFYETPLGQKTIEATPSLMQESMQASQRWSQEVMPGLQEKVTARLEAEGAI